MTTTTNNTGETARNKPSYRVYYVVRQEGQKERWVPVGSAFSHDNGDGLNVLLDTLPINFNGKLVLRPPKQPDDQAAIA